MIESDAKRATLRRGAALAAAAMPALLGIPRAVWAQGAYPAKPVKLIVSFPPGGVTDATFRKFADRFQVHTGQPLVIDNKPGRGVTPNALAIAAPDGYTIGVVGRSQFSLYYQLNGGVAYKPVDSFTWIASLVSSWFGLYVSASSPYRSVADAVAAAKAAPGKLSYGTAFGHGGLAHVPMEDFGAHGRHPDAARALPRRQRLGAPVDPRRHQPDGRRRHAMPFVDDGKLRLLAWLNPSRHPRLTSIPTIANWATPPKWWHRWASRSRA